MRMRFLIGAALALLPATALAQSNAGTSGGGGGGGGSSGPYVVGQYNSTLPTLANGQTGYLQVDQQGRAILSPQSVGSGGGSTGSTSNATDGQATSTTNAANVVYQYVFNGSTWDRARGTGGATFTLSGRYNATLPTLSDGGMSYVQLDANGRQILSPSSSVAVSNFPSSQTVTNGGTFAVQNTAAVVGGNATAVKTDGSATTQPVSGTLAISQATPGTTNGVAITNQATQTTTGAIQPPTAAAGKITRTSTALAANTSTTIAAANASRIAVGIQCASGGVSVDETGGALTAAGVGNGTVLLPSGTTAPYFTPPIASQTALTAYTGTAQTCVVTEYNR